MSLSVNGYLELYTTLLGWQQYQNLWDIASQTGLALIPFVTIIIRHIIEPSLSQEARSASATSLKRMKVSLLGALFVIVFCAQPVIPLTASALNYTPVCQSGATTATPGHTGTTYDSAFPQATSATVPAFWYAVMALSHATTRTAILGLSCEPYDYRQLHSALALSKIQDPELRQEASDFYSSCYTQALAKYEREKPDLSPYTSQTGDADTQWFGSQAFLNMPGYYDTFSASAPVQGFAYDPQRDFEYGQYHGNWGRPTCKDWWNGTGGENGLRSRLLKSLPKPLLSFLETKSEEQDNAIKSLIRQTYAADYQSLNDVESGHYFSKWVGAPIGMMMEKMSYFPKIVLIKSALPIIQAICLMLLYMFLAFAQIFAEYRVKAIVTLTLIIFSVTFWTFLWYVVSYVDQILMQSLYPSLFGSIGSVQANLVDMVIGAGYLLVPALWTLLLSWVGVQVGNGIAAMISGGSSAAHEAGGRAGSLAQQGVTLVTTRGLSSMRSSVNPKQRDLKF